MRSEAARRVRAFPGALEYPKAWNSLVSPIVPP